MKHELMNSNVFDDLKLVEYFKFVQVELKDKVITNFGFGESGVEHYQLLSKIISQYGLLFDETNLSEQVVVNGIPAKGSDYVSPSMGSIWVFPNKDPAVVKCDLFEDSFGYKIGPDKKLLTPAIELALPNSVLKYVD